MTMVRDIYGPMLWLRGEVEISDGTITLDPRNVETYVPTTELDLWIDLVNLAHKDLQPAEIASFARRYGLLQREFIYPSTEIETLPPLQERIADWQRVAGEIRAVNDLYYFLWHATNGQPTEKLAAEERLFQIWEQGREGLCQLVYGVKEVEELNRMKVGDSRLVRFWSAWLAKAISARIAGVREQLVAGHDVIRVQGRRGWTMTAWPGMAQWPVVQEEKAAGHIRPAAEPLDFSFAVVCPDLVALAYWQLGRRMTTGETTARCMYCGKYFRATRKNNTACSKKCGDRFRQRANRMRNPAEKE